MRYKETEKSLPEIADELDVDAVVEGSALLADGYVRLTVGQGLNRRAALGGAL